MNFVFISPNFPSRQFKFCEALRENGINVLGIGDEPYDSLNPRLKEALSEYYYVPSIEEGTSSACKYFASKWGKLDFIESNNEWWLALEAKLRLEFGLASGPLPGDLGPIKAKSEMKSRFAEAGIKTARYILVNEQSDLESAKEFALEVGYPLFAKPNIGVGASGTYKIECESDLCSFLKEPLGETYIIEQFISGTIISYDGIADSFSNPIFDTFEVFYVENSRLVEERLDDFYVCSPVCLPNPLFDGEAFRQKGKKAIKAFGVKNRFFHIEFFVLDKDIRGLGKKGEIVGLEANIRAPGGNSPDLINYANSVSCFKIYADSVAFDKTSVDLGKEKYYAATSSRRDFRNYVYTDEQIKRQYESEIVMSGRYPKSISDDMGDTFYFAKFKTLEEAFAFRQFVSKSIN